MPTSITACHRAAPPWHRPFVLVAPHAFFGALTMVTRAHSAPPGSQAKPNVIFILTEDQTLEEMKDFRERRA
jgi:hypothetical protein